MRLRNRFGAFLGSLILALGGVVALEAPAQAAPFTGCPTTAFCIQTLANQSGSTTYYWNLNNYADNVCVPIGAPHDNTARAVYNRHPTKAARVFTGPGCTGNVIVFNYVQDEYGNCENYNYFPNLYRSYWNKAASLCSWPTASSFQVDVVVF